MDRRVFAALLAFLLVSAPALHSLPGAPTGYLVEDLGTTPDGLVPTVTGINASGQLSGFVSRADGQLRAVRFANGSGWTYPTGLESVYGAATAINASGDLAGYYFAPGVGVRAFRYVDGIGVSMIPTLPGGGFAVAFAIADNGDVVGYGDSPAGTRGWRASAGLPPAVPASLTSTSHACGINGAGQMVGWFTTPAGFQHAFRIEVDGALTDIGTLEDSSGASVACAIDADGRVGGRSSLAGQTHGIVTAGITPADVDSFGSNFSSVEAISNGVAVGRFTLSTGETHAFVNTAAGGSVDLNTLIPAGSGWIVSSATAVNSNGQIAGQGFLGGIERAVRLTPAAAADTTAPVITLMTATPSSIAPPNRAMVPVTVEVSATDDVAAAPSCGLSSIASAGAPAADYAITAPFSAAVRAVGGRTYALTVTCTDAAGNAATRSVDVVVPPDTTPPVVTSLTATPSVVWPPNDALVLVVVAVSATDDSGETPSCALSAIATSGSTADDHSITGPHSAKVRAVGGRTYSLRVSCSDAAGNRGDASVDVVITADTTAPVITALAASPDHIWPPNGKLETVTLSVTATDDVDARPKCSLTSITGAPAADAVITGPLTAGVRSEKDAVYTFNVGCADRAGNKSQASVRVAVSKDPPSAAGARKR